MGNNSLVKNRALCAEAVSAMSDSELMTAAARSVRTLILMTPEFTAPAHEALEKELIIRAYLRKIERGSNE